MYTPITIYTTLVVTCIFLVLSIRTIVHRRNNNISLGDGGNVDMQRIMRAHANFAEYTPIFLILLFLAEVYSAHSYALSLISILFIVGRLVHGYTFAFADIKMSARVFGTACTLISIMLAALLLLSSQL